MGKALVGTGAGIVITTGTLSLDQESAIRDAIEASSAPATRRVYASAWGRFTAWCDAEGHGSLPAAPAAVAAYLAERAQSGLAPASVRLDRAAIRAAHLAVQLPTPTEHPGVAAVTRGLSRQAALTGRTTRQAAALTGEALAAVRATALTPRRGPSGRIESEAAARKRGNVDIALASTMRDGLLRRSEAAALTWGDVELRSDGTGRVLIARSKTDQEGEGAVQYRATHRLDPGARDRAFPKAGASLDRRQVLRSDRDPQGLALEGVQDLDRGVRPMLHAPVSERGQEPTKAGPHAIHHGAPPLGCVMTAGSGNTDPNAASALRRLLGRDPGSRRGSVDLGAGRRLDQSRSKSGPVSLDPRRLVRRPSDQGDTRHGGPPDHSNAPRHPLPIRPGTRRTSADKDIEVLGCWT